MKKDASQIRKQKGTKLRWEEMKIIKENHYQLT